VPTVAHARPHETRVHTHRHTKMSARARARTHTHTHTHTHTCVCAEAKVSSEPRGESTWVHELMVAEKGCLLLANPEFFKGTQSYFDKSVIAVIEHADEVSVCMRARAHAHAREQMVRARTRASARHVKGLCVRVRVHVRTRRAG